MSLRRPSPLSLHPPLHVNRWRVDGCCCSSAALISCRRLLVSRGGVRIESERGIESQGGGAPREKTR